MFYLDNVLLKDNAFIYLTSSSKKSMVLYYYCCFWVLLLLVIFFLYFVIEFKFSFAKHKTEWKRQQQWHFFRLYIFFFESLHLKFYFLSCFLMLLHQPHSKLKNKFEIMPRVSYELMCFDESLQMTLLNDRTDIVLMSHKQ